MPAVRSMTDRHLPGDRPQERENFSRDGRDDHVWVLPTSPHATVSPAESHLRLPGDVLDRLWTPFEPLLQVFRHFGRIPIRARRLDERPACVAIAGLRDGPEANGRLWPNAG